MWQLARCTHSVWVVRVTSADPQEWCWRGSSQAAQQQAGPQQSVCWASSGPCLSSQQGQNQSHQQAVELSVADLITSSR